jgi:transposase
MLLPSQGMKVFLALGNTDMRKSINGLSVLVESSMDLDPFSGHLFVFCNRRRNILKILYWDRNGFCLWHKRLEKDRFRWPESEDEVLNIGHRELMWLIEGLEIMQHGAHKRLSYSVVC